MPPTVEVDRIEHTSGTVPEAAGGATPAADVAVDVAVEEAPVAGGFAPVEVVLALDLQPAANVARTTSPTPMTIHRCGDACMRCVRISLEESRWPAPPHRP